jgi:hypothetical protein
LWELEESYSIQQHEPVEEVKKESENEDEGDDGDEYGNESSDTTYYKILDVFHRNSEKDYVYLMVY